MSAIEPTITFEQYGTNVRVTQDWTSVIDKMARDIADRIDEATLARLGYVKQETCHVDVLNTGDCAGYECSEYIMHCNECGHEFGYVLYNEDGDVWMSEPPNFCPNCGAKVVVE